MKYPARRTEAALVALRAAISHFASKVTVLALIGATVGLVATGRDVMAQVLVPSAEELTQTLVALNRQRWQTPPNEQAKVLNALLQVAATRQQLLAGLIDDEPEEVLRVALPARVRASFPAAVELYLEEHIETEGLLEVLVEDKDTGGRVHYFLTNEQGERFSLHFAADEQDLHTGSRVRVRGIRVGYALALDSGGGTTLETVTLALPNTFGEQRTIVILVNFQDKATEPYTVAYANDVTFNTTSGFYWEGSYQQTWLAGGVVGWFTIPLNSTVCDTGKIASYAKSAATAAGVNLSAYTRYVYAFPKNACTWWGLGSVGGNPSQAWINGSFQLVVLGHELGHGLGLRHSHALECGTTTLGPSCSSLEYGDTLDIMGIPSAGHFNAFQKERLGWLNYGISPPIATVVADGTYWLDPYAVLGSSPAGLKVWKSTDATTGKRTWYYIEFRQPTGFDGFLSTNNNVTTGVVVHTGTESTGTSSYLLDMTAQTSSWNDPALVVGDDFYDPNAAVSIVPLSAGETGALVSVTFGPQPCVQANPLLSLSPSTSQWVQAGTPVTYTVSVTNNDNAACNVSTFDLMAVVPSGWPASFASAALVLAPGASASTTLEVTSLTSTGEGFYDLTVTATNRTSSAFAASVSVTQVIVSSLTVAASTDKASYTRNQSVSITARVTGGSSPVSSASVAFTITRPNGTVVVQNATTGTNGSAVTKLRLKRQDPAGTYQVRADANLNGLSGTGLTSFVVQ